MKLQADMRYVRFDAAAFHRLISVADVWKEMCLLIADFSFHSQRLGQN